MFKENRGRYQVKTPTGYKNFVGIQVKTTKELLCFECDDSTILKCSTNHLLLTNDGMVPANEITLNHTITGKTIKTITYELGSFDVYDPIGVEEHSTYLSNGLVSHNCEFLGSVNTLISATKLRSMTWVNPKKDHLGVDVYHDPIEGHTYSITVDTAHGVGLDYSTFSVIDITAVPYILAAKFRDNTVGPMIFPELIYATARRYNNAYVLVETNDVGQVVAESLHRELEYENVISTITGGQGKDRKVNSGFGPKSMFGIRTTPAVKRIGCANIRDIIEGDKLIIQDFDIINEFYTFAQKKLSYEAEEGQHDDLVMSLVLFGWLARQPYLKDLTDTDVRRQLAEQRYADVIEDMLPAGFISDGQEEDSLEFDLRYDSRNF